MTTSTLWIAFVVIVAASLLAAPSAANEADHQYEDGDTVVLWVNKVAPNLNPQETYPYHSLPFCTPLEKQIQYKADTIGSLLEGNELKDSGLLIQFKQDRPSKKICHIEMTASTVQQFNDVIQEQYWYQMYFDELLIWGLIGELDYKKSSDTELKDIKQHEAFLYTHRKLAVTYNNNQIIGVNITSDNLVPLIVGESYPMTFEVVWTPTTDLFENRFDHYLDFDFFEHQIHWFSIFNSLMMVLFLCGLVALILMRTLRNDYAKYTLEDDRLDIDSVSDESGWKQVHGDVFRKPSHLPLFAALIGVGHQLYILVVLLSLFAIAGNLYSFRGQLVTYGLLAWALTAFVCGFSSASFYKRNNGKTWKLTLGISIILLPLVLFSIFFPLNFIAIMYQSSAAMPFTSIIQIICIWLFVTAPLTWFGTTVGRVMTKSGDFPCRTSTMRRPIPLGPWYTDWRFIALLGGILPFGSIFIEMHFILTSFWNYKFYYVYGFLLLVIFILTCVTMCVSVVSTYFLLNSENYLWQWMSFFSGASTGIYVFLYSTYYFLFKTSMSGFFQTVYFFGYTALSSMLLACICGAVAYTGASLLVHKIYRNIKSD